MKGAAIAAGLLLGVLSFALAFAPRRTALIAAGMAVLAAIAAHAVRGVSGPAAFMGCWISLGLAALAVYWPRPLAGRRWPTLALALNAGIWAGLVEASEGLATPLPRALPALLLGLPAAWCIARGWTIVPRVVTSWFLAAAVLTAMIPLLIVHPGYVPDHRL